MGGVVVWALANWKLVLGAVLGLALLIAAAVIYHKGEVAGSADVRDKVNTTTNSTLDKERKAEERDRDVIRKTPYKDKLDQLD